MNDGWGDDTEDLDLDQEEDNWNSTHNDQDEGDNDNDNAKDASGNGWNEDEDLFSDDDDDDDDNDNDDNDNDNDADNQDVNVSNVMHHHKESQPPTTSDFVPSTSADGWGDDDEDLNIDSLDYDWGDGANTQTPALPEESQQTTNGWDDPDDIVLDDHDDEQYEEQANEAEDQFPQTFVPKPPKVPLIVQLEEYINSLSRIQSSINAVLEYEYNTPEKAQELVEYYSKRPGLAEYTRTKEVPRMNYQVVLPDGNVETSKQKIAQYHLPDHSIIARCSNQSLLADMLQVLTGNDLVVRPQFLAICVAETCLFRLHMGDSGRDMVQCSCMLKLSLPVAEGPRLDIATIRTTIVFAPQQLMVKFRIDKIIVPFANNNNNNLTAKLQPVVDFLTMMEGHFDELPGHEDLALQHAPADQFRDAFLENSQILLTQGTAGMKSALQDMEAVIGLKSKFNAVRGGISKFLPNTNVLLAAEEEANALAAAREREQAARAQMPRPPPPPPPPPQQAQSQPPVLQAPPPTTQPPQRRPNEDIPTRPKSILGGLVSSGWSALAKSVTLPDEETIISNIPPNSASSQRRPPPPLTLYRKEETAPPAPAFPRPPSGNVVSPSIPVDPTSSTRAHPQQQQPQKVPPQQHMLPPPIPTPAVPLTHPPPEERPPHPPQVVAPPAPSIPPPPPPPKNNIVPNLAPTNQVQQPFVEEEDDNDEESRVTSVAEDRNSPHLETTSDYGVAWGDDDDLDIDDEELNFDEEQQSQSEVSTEEEEKEHDAQSESSTEEVEEDEVDEEMEQGTTLLSINTPPDQETAKANWAQPSAPIEVLGASLVEKTESQLIEATISDPVASPQTLLMEKERTAMEFVNAIPQREVVVDIPYNPDDDIIETRKRWVNPRPNRPYIIF